MTIKEQYQNRIKNVFAEDLQNAGFISYNNENLCWYKVINHKVLCSVFFFIQWMQPPLFPQIHYCAYPLYVPVPVPERSIRVPDRFDWHGMIPRAFPGEFPVQGSDIQFNFNDEGDRVLLKSEIFPMFDAIHNLKDCYASNKAYWQKWNINGYERSGRTHNLIFPFAFIDEVICNEDKEMYPYCKARIQPVLDSHPTDKYAPLWQKQLDALNSIRREDYLAYLEERKQKFVRKLEKKLGIQV